MVEAKALESPIVGGWGVVEGWGNARESMARPVAGAHVEWRMLSSPVSSPILHERWVKKDRAPHSTHTHTHKTKCWQHKGAVCHYLCA